MKAFSDRSIALCLLLGLTSCASVGPSRLETDRFDYNEALSESWNSQILLNIVKLRYSDWPSFLDVEQIVAQYTIEQTGSTKGILRSPFNGEDQLEAGWVGKFSERPAILYKPVRGSKYMKSILTPAPPDAVLGLVNTGWPVKRMFEIMVHSANGRQNTQVETSLHFHPDREFESFLNVLQEYQVRDALLVEFERVDQPEGKVEVLEAYLGFRTERVDAELRGQLDQVKAELGLDPEINRYRVVWGSIPPNPQTISLETRSVLQLMVVMAAHVETLPGEVEEGRVRKLKPKPRENQTGLKPIITIHSGDTPPVDAHVVCRYRNRWFWIADTDVDSKNSFSYLSLLLTLGETDDRGGAPLVISTN